MNFLLKMSEFYVQKFMETMNWNKLGLGSLFKVESGKISTHFKYF